MVNRVPIKQMWIQRCIDVYKFHAEQMKLNGDWTLEQTAAALNRSTGSISQDILIARWLRTHETQIRKFKFMTDALRFVKSKKRESFLAGI